MRKVNEKCTRVRDLRTPVGVRRISVRSAIKLNQLWDKMCIEYVRNAWLRLVAVILNSLYTKMKRECASGKLRLQSYWLVNL